MVATTFTSFMHKYCIQKSGEDDRLPENFIEYPSSKFFVTIVVATLITVNQTDIFYRRVTRILTSMIFIELLF